MTQTNYGSAHDAATGLRGTWFSVGPGLMLTAKGWLAYLTLVPPTGSGAAGTVGPGAGGTIHPSNSGACCSVLGA